MKLTTADTKKTAFANWCMLVSRTICALQGYVHLKTAPAVHQHHKASKLCIPVQMPVHRMCILNYSLHLATQFHAMQTLSYSGHMCLGVESERKEQNRTEKTKPFGANSIISQILHQAAQGGLSHLESPPNFQITYCCTHRLASTRLPLSADSTQHGFMQRFEQDKINTSMLNAFQ